MYKEAKNQKNPKTIKFLGFFDGIRLLPIKTHPSTLSIVFNS